MSVPNSTVEEFVDEIDFNDLDFREIVGRGAFGTVQRAVYAGHEVAIKILDATSGVKEYEDEVKQLSRVQHIYIIRIFGTSINKQKLYIVMEYADCGSLYNLLHPAEPEDEVCYNLGHVMSWSRQCAEAVEYLHSLDPKVIHRDLKPPNMLLTDYGKVIKICDFGTATQMHTEMTSNKGSAAWMAPEVFEGKRYSEKCDVYSFGIVLWEMLSRRKPFDEIGPPAFRILWAVYTGTRPPPLQGISSCLMNLIEKCWAKDQSKRPSFTEIVKFFRIAEEIVEGADEPIFCDDEFEDENNELADSIKSNQIEYTPSDDPGYPVAPPIGDFFPENSMSPADERPPMYHRQNSQISPSMLPQSFYHTPGNAPVVDYSQMSPRSCSSSSSAKTTPQSVIKKSPVFGNHGNHDNNTVLLSEYSNVDWSVVPQDLMPIKPINSIKSSVQMYNNYNETLKKYIDLQGKIKNFRIQKEILDNQIADVDKAQKKNAYNLERYVKLDNDKTNLLELHRSIKSTLESEKARRMLNRSRSHTP